MAEGTTTQKSRLIAGILQEYASYSLDDFAILHQGQSLMVLVIPKLTNQLQMELTLKNKSKCGTYNFIQCLNIILEHHTPSIAAQISLPCDQVTLPFLMPFDLETRLVGELTLFYF